MSDPFRRRFRKSQVFVRNSSDVGVRPLIKSSITHTADSRLAKTTIGFEPNRVALPLIELMAEDRQNQLRRWVNRISGYDLNIEDRLGAIDH